MPSPITPSTLLKTSLPCSFFFSQSPDFNVEVPQGMLRVKAIIMAMVCSAVVMTLPVGVFITTTPRLVAAGISPDKPELKIED